MKRLIKKSSTMTLYHKTSLDRMDRIISLGLIPQGGGEEYMMAGPGVFKKEQLDNYYGYVFLSDYIGGNATQLGSVKKPIALEIDIDTEYLSVDTNDCEHCKTWQQSLATTHQCKTNKEIAPTDIKKVHYLDENNNVIFSCSLDEFNQEYEEYFNIKQDDDNKLKNLSWLKELSENEIIDVIKNADFDKYITYTIKIIKNLILNGISITTGIKSALLEETNKLGGLLNIFFENQIEITGEDIVKIFDLNKLSDTVIDKFSQNSIKINKDVLEEYKNNVISREECVNKVIL
jgi:hypothetical protein